LSNIVGYYGEEHSTGRLRGHQSYSTMSILSSIAQIAANHNLDSRLLLDAFTEAWAHGESQYEKLKVECRKVDHDFATFLITCNDKVVWQFPIGIEIFKGPELFKSYFPTVSNPIRREGDSSQKHISDLRANMRGIAVKAKIVEVPLRQLVNTRYGLGAYVSNVLLADETGTIRLGLWNSQIDGVAVGDAVKIEKAKVATFYGMLQLRIGRSGTISVDKSAGELTTV
jgi:replication factor A1